MLPEECPERRQTVADTRPATSELGANHRVHHGRLRVHVASGARAQSSSPPFPVVPAHDGADGERQQGPERGHGGHRRAHGRQLLLAEKTGNRPRAVRLCNAPPVEVFHLHVRPDRSETNVAPTHLPLQLIIRSPVCTAHCFYLKSLLTVCCAAFSTHVCLLHSWRGRVPRVTHGGCAYDYASCFIHLHCTVCLSDVQLYLYM